MPKIIQSVFKVITYVPAALQGGKSSAQYFRIVGSNIQHLKHLRLLIVSRCGRLVLIENLGIFKSKVEITLRILHNFSKGYLLGQSAKFKRLTLAYFKSMYIDSNLPTLEGWRYYVYCRWVYPRLWMWYTLVKHLKFPSLMIFQYLESWEGVLTFEVACDVA